MRLIPRVVPTLSVVVLALAGLTACNIPVNTLVDGISVTAPVGEVHIVHPGSGDVTVKVDATHQRTDVKRTVHYGGSAPAQTATVDGSTLVLDMHCGSNCSASYDVTLPAPAKVSGDNSSGDINVSGVSAVEVTTSSGNVTVNRVNGPVTATASSGDIDVTSVTGPVNLRTTSGNITARDLSAPTTTAQATSGDVTIQLATVADVTAGTTSGNIEIRVPDGAFQVSTSVTSGDVHVGIPTDPAAAHKLDAHATSGDINVNRG